MHRRGNTLQPKDRDTPRWCRDTISAATLQLNLRIKALSSWHLAACRSEEMQVVESAKACFKDHEEARANALHLARPLSSSSDPEG